MTTDTLVTIELVKMIAAYLLLVCVPPAIVFSEKLIKNNFPYTSRIMAYLMIGNIFIINLVLYLALFHICNRFTLILFSVLFYTIMAVYLYQIHVKDLIEIARRTMINFGSGYLGRKTLRAHAREKVLGQLHRFFSGTIGMILKHPIESLGFVGTIIAVLRVFCSNNYWQLGYKASDIPVHNFWINALGENKAFVDGVYPMGYHCVIFFIHKVTGIDTYVLLANWNVITILLIVIAMMCLVGYICKKAPFLSYLAVLIFVLWNGFSSTCYGRYMSGIPQEYGEIFLFPALIFVFEFFRRRKKEKGGSHSTSTLCWLLFSCGLSLTICIHFYDTIVLLFFCIGIGLAHVLIVFQKKYIFSLLKSAGLALLVALLPMTISLMMGNHFQGSMGWALGVMRGKTITNEGSGNATVYAYLSDDDYSDDLAYYAYLKKRGVLTEEEKEAYKETKIKSGMTVYDPVEITPQPKDSFIKRIWIKQKNFVNKITGVFSYVLESLCSATRMNMLYNNPDYDWMFYFVFACLIFLALCGSVGLVFNWDNATSYMSFAIGTMFLWALLASEQFHLPSIMDANRTIHFLCPLMGIGVTLAFYVFLEGALYRTHFRWPYIVISVFIIGFYLYSIKQFDFIRKPIYLEACEYNGNIICLESIMRENDDFTYTIVSANDETQMVWEKGYHYEIIEFLQRLHAFRGGQYSDAFEDLSKVDDGDIYIPTPKVYVYIEKKPHTGGIQFEMQPLSEEGASQKVPKKANDAYKGANNWVCMSKMYYWALAYQELIPDDMRVYYEDENMICYEIDQNANRIYNFSIDYGFNDCGEGKIKIDD